MRSLLVRIFVSFWLMIVLTIVVAVAAGYFYAERARTAIENFEVSDAMIEASESLQRGGRDGLTEWLDSLPGVTKSLVYILDEKNRDLLRRRLPGPVAIAVRRFGGARSRRPMRREFDNLRPARPFTELIGPEGRTYTIFVLPPQGVAGRWLADRGRATLIFLALIVSGAVSYLLARTISRPIGKLRESAAAIADGDLATRVAAPVGRRRDEIGLLAQDFDRMARKLQKASARQTELTRNVSHELRSPLARLRVALELVRRKAGDLPELAKIETETERLDGLIGQLLEFSRLDADTGETRARLDLGEVVAAVVRFEYGGTDAAPEIDLDIEGQCEVDAYPGALAACIENVLRNAAQHGRPGGRISTRVRADEPDAVVSVQDDGGGVPERDLAHLFEPFYRASDDAGGSGLGLAIAARAAALNGGRISAANDGVGLRVTIRLPLAP